MQASIDTAQLKSLLKEAVVELFEERHDLFQAVLEEALEDIALARAIQIEENSEPISREEVFGVLGNPSA